MMDYKFYQSSLAHNNGKTSGQYKTAKVIDWLNENIATYTPNLRRKSFFKYIGWLYSSKDYRL